MSRTGSQDIYVSFSNLVVAILCLNYITGMLTTTLAKSVANPRVARLTTGQHHLLLALYYIPIGLVAKRNWHQNNHNTGKVGGKSKDGKAVIGFILYSYRSSGKY